jgi:hypothetical protein
LRFQYVIQLSSIVRRPLADTTGEGDFDNNGIVDFYDFAVFGQAW